MSGYGAPYGYGAAYGYDTDDVLAADEILLWEQYKEQPNIQTLLRNLIKHLQTLEDGTEAIATIIPFDTASGWWLDNLYGKILDMRRRNAWSDTFYRQMLRAKQAALASKGTAPDILRVARLIIGSTTDPLATTFRPEYPRGYRLELPNVDHDLWNIATDLLTLATAAGIRGVLVFYETTTDHFTYGGPHGYGDGELAHMRVIYGSG